jgi:drug/metabolite transporter (DMT)-like permease
MRQAIFWLRKPAQIANAYAMHKHPLYAIGLMLAAMFAFASMTAMVRLLSESMQSTQIVLLRNLFSLALILGWSALLVRGRPRFATSRMKSHLWRAMVGFCSMQLWFYCLGIMPLTLATALSFTTPIFATLLAMVFLGEKAGIRRLSAIGVSFVGVLVILQPDSSGLAASSLLVLLSSALIAWSSLLVKSLTATDSSETIIFYMTAFMLVFSLPAGLMAWQTPTAYQLWLAFLVGFFSIVAHLLTTRALALADMVTLMPFDYTRLLFASAYAYWLFDETMGWHTLIGALIIALSSLYIAHREARLKRLAVLATTLKEGPVL